MNIRESIYQSLTPRQRITATLEALARNDISEKERLINTCTRTHYIQTDHAYSASMDKLMLLSMAVEFELMSAAITYLVYDEIPILLEKFAYIEQGWIVAMGDHGIDYDLLRRAGVPRSAEINYVFNLAKTIELEPETVQEYRLVASALIAGLQLQEVL